MVRVIFFCMAIVALALAAIPMMQVFDGISKERHALQTQFDVAETAPIENEDVAPSAEMLNQIESAAGGSEDLGVTDTTSELQGGFSGRTPEGL